MGFELKLNSNIKMGFELKLNSNTKMGLELKLKAKVWLRILTSHKMDTVLDNYGL